MTTSRAELDRLMTPIADGMRRMNALLAQNVQDASPAVRDMTSHVARFQGKRLRAALVLLTGEATGNTTDEHSTVAVIVEMIHLATLVHDDILDGAQVRRRVACVNERWDNQVAVLLGDFLYARAFALSTTLSSRLCSRLLSETTRRLCVGEIEQSTRRYDFDMSQADYEQIAGSKTASLYSAACELGARYPGGNEELGQSMARFGWNLGLAFQIVDDCLDLTGTTAELGKSGRDRRRRRQGHAARALHLRPSRRRNARCDSRRLHASRTRRAGPAPARNLRLGTRAGLCRGSRGGALARLSYTPAGPCGLAGARGARERDRVRAASPVLSGLTTRASNSVS